MISISAETNRRILAMFQSVEHDIVIDTLLKECGDNLPLVNSSYAQLAERIRFAVIKLSKGDIWELNKWVNHSKIDWRDVLMAAGFGNGVEDHLKWWPNEDNKPEQSPGPAAS